MIFHMASCGGCTTCEMGCSFFHTGEFNPAVSSIRIFDREDGLGFVVSLAEKSDGQTIACTGCEDVETPWCAQYCEKADDLIKIVRQFMENRKG